MIRLLETLINEHGSSAILRDRLGLVADQVRQMERQLVDLQRELAETTVELRREKEDHVETKNQLQKLKDEHTEEVIIHRTIEFRRGKRTRDEWAPFCPNCHTPVTGDKRLGVYCTICVWKSSVSKADLEHILSEEL